MGPFGYGNLGDASTQDAMIEHLRREFPGVEIFGFSLNPKDTEARHGIKSFPISWQSWEGEGERKRVERIADWLTAQDKPTLRQLARLILRGPRELGLVRDTFELLGGIDVLIISGGGQLDDYWGNGPWGYPYTFLKWCAVARLIGVRVLLVSVGAGPIRAWLSKRSIRWGLALTACRSYRDTFSSRLIQDIGLETVDPVYPDLAFSLGFDGIHPAERPLGARRVVGLGPIGYFKKGSWPQHDEAIYGGYLDKLASFAKWLLEGGSSVVFLPGEVHYDQSAIGDLMDRLAGMVVEMSRVIRPAVSPAGDLLAQLASTDLVVSSRFHAL